MRFCFGCASGNVVQIALHCMIQKKKCVRKEGINHKAYTCALISSSSLFFTFLSCKISPTMNIDMVAFTFICRY